MTTVQPPRHRAPAGASRSVREPHPSGPVAVTPRVVRPAAVADESPTVPIPRAALDAVRVAAPVAPVGPSASVAPAPRRRRRWPWIVGGVLLVFIIIGSTGSTTPSAPTPAPAPAASPAAGAPSVTAPAQVTLPSDVVGRNAQIVDDQLRGLGLTNVSFASQDPQDTVVVLLQNWTVTGIEPGAGTSVAPGDAVVVTVTKGAAGTTGRAAPASTAPVSAGPATSFGDGTHVVGQDIEPGTYRTAGPAAGGMGMCYWSRLRNTSGEFDAIIANGVPTGPSTVTIRSGDAAFETTGCQTWTKTN